MKEINNLLKLVFQVDQTTNPENKGTELVLRRHITPYPDEIKNEVKDFAVSNNLIFRVSRDEKTITVGGVI